MTSIRLDDALLQGIEQFIAHRDERGRMTYEDAVNVIVRDWLMGQGYIPMPDDPDDIKLALPAAKVPGS